MDVYDLKMVLGDSSACTAGRTFVLHVSNPSLIPDTSNGNLSPQGMIREHRAGNKSWVPPGVAPKLNKKKSSYLKS